MPSKYHLLCTLLTSAIFFCALTASLKSLRELFAYLITEEFDTADLIIPAIFWTMFYASYTIFFCAK